MKLIKQLKEEVLDVYEAYWGSLFTADMETYAAVLDNDFKLIGTTEGEVFFKKIEATRFLKATADQLVGSIELRNRKIKVEPVDALMLITEQSAAYVNTDGAWAFYAKVRSSALLQKKEDRWKFVQMHISLPDSMAEEGETIALENITKENLELKEAVKRRTVELENKTRKLEIESSLERVRTVTMGMNTPGDVLNICKVFFNELQSLGFKDLRNALINFWDDKNGQLHDYDYSDFSGGNFAKLAYSSHPAFAAFQKKIRKSKDAFAKLVINKDGLKSWQQRRRNSGEYKDPRLSKISALYYYFYSTGVGALGISTFSPISKEEVEVLKRFRNVFDIAYQRYVDIQKSAAQSREAQIELALERVRARTMAMKHSDELLATVSVMFEQFKALGEEPERMAIEIVNEKEHVFDIWATQHGGSQLNLVFKASLDEPHVMLKMYKAWKTKTKSITIDLQGKPLEEYFTFLKKGGLPVQRKIFGKRRVQNVATFSKGILTIITPEPRPQETIHLLERFAAVFEQTYTRFLDLQKAEAQVKEAQIEAALERVRSKSMAMHKSGELQNVIQVVFEQFNQLNIIIEHTGFIIDYKQRDNMHIWLADQYASPVEITIPYFDSPHWNSFIIAKKNGDRFFANLLSFEEKNKFYQDLFKLIPALPKEKRQAIFNKPGLAISTALLENIGLYIENFSGTPYTDEENAVLIRFGKVFQQTYTRFLDLQKAEAQTREAQIELALERVRARTMAMQHSNELPEAASLLFQQVQSLGMPAWSAGYCTWNNDKKSAVTLWMSSEGVMQSPFIAPTTKDKLFIEMRKGAEDGKTLHVVEMGGKKLVKHYQYMRTLPVVGEILDSIIEAGHPLPDFQIMHKAYFSKGFLLFITYQSVPDAHGIFQRFAKVFDQTYTRFLDLKKAEAQVREAQIEAAVERVRAQSMAMYHTTDLATVNEELLMQLNKLNIAGLTGVSLYLVDDKGFVKVWDLSSPGNMEDANSYAFKYDYKKYPTLGEFVGIWKAAKQDYFILDFPKEKLLQAVEELQQVQPEVAQHFSNAIECGLLQHQWNPAGRLSNGILSIDLMQPPTEDTKNIVLKMAGAFNMAYQRFLDLQKAEAQAKEAQIETALEKVRSRTMAMQSSNELQETAAVLFNEFKKLGTEDIYQVTIGIYNEEEGIIDFRSTSWADDGAQESRSFSLSMEEPTVIKPAVIAWKANKKSLVIDLSGEALEGWLNYRNKISGITKMSADTGGRRVITAAYYSKGHLSISTPVPVPADTLRTLERFAAVFDSTYTRFLDLKKAEAQALRAEQDLIAIKEAKQKAEEALTELQATQKQLIQSEKMASLGELTAGIAHEIQNPLNFVNNFSEVSKELLDEMKQAIEKGDTEEAKEIMNDVIQNLEKINHHGKRADGIVKGMLQHSSSGNGKKEPTNINALADEYLRLAYHGLRAKDKSFNATMKTDFDESIGNINIVPQDIGRVILNLITNAFYVVNEKSKQNIAGYEPTVAISTASIQPPSGGQSIIIKVSDNGGGIPQKLLDKIFQPFFTTKPTGQGTGLGLSLSYDIVKAHGGELKVETKEGEGSTFILQIPTT